MYDLEIIIKYDKEAEEIHVSNGGYWWTTYGNIKTRKDIIKAVDDFIKEEQEKQEEDLYFTPTKEDIEEMKYWL